MSQLDWDKFNALAGSRPQNFENLCRGLMHLHFESVGEFRALKNQPGVEMHLKLTDSSPTLGLPPRWRGWQCKVYALTNEGNLLPSGRKGIEKSLRKTEKYLPELTDWVLWTPYTLSKKDQEWFYGLKTDMGLHLWTAEEVNTYLSGPGSILRNTYFGDLIATSEELAKRHQESIQPIKERWFEPVHQITETERTLRCMLGEPKAWAHLLEVGERLQNVAVIMTESVNSFDSFPKEIITKFIESCQSFSETISQFYKELVNGDIETVKQQLKDYLFFLDDDIKSTPRLLRRFNAPISLDATNALYDMRMGHKLLDEVKDFLSIGLVAVLADAGGGKTQLSAAITTSEKTKPAGIFLHGRNLHRGQNLNDLAKTYTLNGKPIESFEQLLAALDAAAKRYCCRLPVVIDGLNEAENPKDWKAPLASLEQTVKSYPNVLVICTLRTGEHKRKRSIGVNDSHANTRESFAVMALPMGIRLIESEGFGADTEEAIAKYFSHFNIDADDAEIPMEFLEHPLTLRIFCQVTNPSRQSIVHVHYFPASLTSLFEKYLESSAQRIAELPNLSYSYSEDDVLKVLHYFGQMLWEQGAREIKEEDLINAAGYSKQPWQSSIINLLVQEGLIFRNPGEHPYDYVITPAYDTLGGFMIARSLLQTNERDSSFNWFKLSKTIDLFVHEDQSHPLALDIFRALVSLTPVRTRQQLWRVAPGNLRNAALLFAIELDPQYLDSETVEALRLFFAENPKKQFRFFSRICSTRAVVEHPLNSEFLDKILRSITSVGERDLSWTEWIRLSREKRLADVIALEKKWELHVDRKESDRLKLKWLMWHLTSTDRELRDIVTRALYWFGRKAPSVLFDETIKSLDINDPYIPERMLAASYGVAMAHQGNFEYASFTSHELPRFAREVYNSIFSEGAPYKTTHILLREYAMRIVELTNFYDSTFFSAEEMARATPPFQMANLDQWGMKDDPISPVASPFQMDFENYTIGGLVPDRRNYDYEHEGYKSAKKRILWRIEQLGWFEKDFTQIDHKIVKDQDRLRPNNNPKKIDSYGKKYSWIAYFEMAGLLHDLGLLNRNHAQERISDVDIDPSFPKRVQKDILFDGDLLGSSDLTVDDWISTGSQIDMTPYLRVDKIGENDCPWVTLDGYIGQENKRLGRRSFCFVRSFIVKNTIAEDFLKYLSHRDIGGRWVPEKPSVYYAFSGEIPWCTTYPEDGKINFSFIKEKKIVKVEKTCNELYLDVQKLNISEFDLIRRNLFGIDPKNTDVCDLSDTDIERIEERNISFDADEDQQEFEEYEAIMPCCDFGWERYHSATNDSGYAVILTKSIAKDLNLINRAQEFDLFTKDGIRATLNISDHSEDFNNHQSFFCLREDLLQLYLKKNDSTFIWVTWGERQYSSKKSNNICGDIKNIMIYPLK
ncbi:MAG: hypothetical protein RR808_01810 [Akkermansia sp.]